MKVGDRVRCIDTDRCGNIGSSREPAYSLTKDKIYRVIGFNDIGILIINNNGVKDDFFESRFVLHNNIWKGVPK